ncbi:hypothetical protein Leryth_026197 [Lithospermum erythrorhizon]|nr:hypothetical protein Leryth_026197 [Lithospermum erythrorhizon]
MLLEVDAHLFEAKLNRVFHIWLTLPYLCRASIMNEEISSTFLCTDEMVYHVQEALEKKKAA